MEESKKFLPIGTIVLLKGGKRELMITSYCVVPNGDVYDKTGKVEDIKRNLYDYGACLYPEGMIVSDQTFVFNHNQIERVCYMGYETEKQKDLSTTLNKNFEQMQEGVDLINKKIEEQAAA